MLTTRSLLLFAAASLPLILFPGPSVGFILATTLRGGRRSGLAATAGFELGYLVHVVGAAVGVSAVIATTAGAFTAVKVAGAPAGCSGWHGRHGAGQATRPSPSWVPRRWLPARPAWRSAMVCSLARSTRRRPSSTSRSCLSS